MSHLVPCPGCARHVRQSEAQCPFCNAALALDHLPPPVLPRGRMGRAATFAFGASLVGATSLIACGSSFEEGGGGSSGAPMPVYGAPAAGMAGQQSGGSATGGSATGGSATGGTGG
ncbi:MAG TPA: hypothetical protein VEX18_16045, partial [Polyangiaceae bacterium]|nr:hypothetical protein [Polyangiaceae bacterium]